MKQLMFYYFLKRLWKIIDFCSKKTTMSFISVFIMLVLAGWVVIFISGQILLGKLSLLKSLNIDSGFINNVFNNVIVNKDRIKILSLSINILLSVSAANLLLPCSYKYKVGTVYIMSSIAPLVINCVFYKWCSINFIINFCLYINTFV